MEQPRATICVAERNANIRDLLRREFGREGYAVVTAGSETELLARLDATEGLDLLVLDAEMGDPEGGSLAGRIRRRHPLVAVVLHVFPGLDAGEDDLVRVEKGGDFERLKRAVRKVLAGRAATARPGQEA